MGKKVLHWEGNAETLCLSLQVFCTIILYSGILGSGYENSRNIAIFKRDEIFFVLVLIHYIRYSSVIHISLLFVQPHLLSSTNFAHTFMYV